MKLELEIGDDLWKRIEFAASVYHKPAADYLTELLDERVLRIPDPEGAKAAIAAIRASVGPEDDYDIEEFVHDLERSRGHLPAATSTGRNGENR